MQINNIEVKHLKIPLKKSYKLSKAYGTLRTTEPVVVKIFTDEGVCGIGETDPMPLFTGESPETVKEILKNYLGEAILGKDPTNIAEIHKVMDSMVKSNYLAKACIDIACYDILGKKVRLPVHRILGGKLREEISFMGSIGTSTPEKNAEEVKKLKETGYTSMMIKVGGLDLKEDLERIKAVRNQVGNDYPLIIDANQGWDVFTTIKFDKLASDLNIALLEQPIPYWDLEGMAKVRDNISIPISADESLFTLHDAQRLVQRKAADVFSIKVVKHGGIYNTKRIMNFASVHGIPCLMNSMIEEGISQASSLQLAASANNLYKFGHAYFSPLRLEKDITSYSTQISNGSVKINNKPGLGIELLDKNVKEYLVDSFNIS